MSDKLATPTVTLMKTQGSRYAQCSSETMQQTKIASVPQKTRQDTTWCVNQWENWTRWKNSLTSIGQFEAIPSSPITSLSRETLAKYMAMFTLEVRKKDGSEYIPGNIICGLMRHLRACGDVSIDFFKNGVFADFRSILDGEMKRLRTKGLGTCTKKAECIDTDEEDVLWTKGILGDHSPSAFLILYSK